MAAISNSGFFCFAYHWRDVFKCFRAAYFLAIKMLSRVNVEAIISEFDLCQGLPPF